MSDLGWRPAVEVESNAGTREVALLTRHLMKRNVFISGEINADMANDIIMQLMYLQGESEEPINIYINSPGGEVTAGLLIYDVIQSLTVPVNTYCTGLAASMGAVLLAGGQAGRRYILPHSKTMIHEPLISGGVGGSATSIHNISESILKTRDMLNEILAKHTGKSLKDMKKATAFDHYMNAEESVKFGMCDEIVEKLV